jgi:hypothetical protein
VASWNDLRAAFEHASGRKLGPFFEQWLSRAGAPKVQLVSARGGKDLQVALEQSRPAYVLRLPLEFSFEGGRVETRWVEIGRERETLSVQFKDRPRSVRLDPQLRVYRLLDPEELPPILRQWIVARSPAVLFAGKSKAAAVLAERLLESPYREVTLGDREPLLIVGQHADVDAALSRLGLPPRPALLAGKGSAQVWTVPRSTTEAATPVAVISAKDDAALEALARPLPHYGAQSYLAFDGARAIERGTWPPASPAVPVTN